MLDDEDAEVVAEEDVVGLEVDEDDEEVEGILSGFVGIVIWSWCGRSGQEHKRYAAPHCCLKVVIVSCLLLVF